jgi:hypothetical protein
MAIINKKVHSGRGKCATNIYTQSVEVLSMKVNIAKSFVVLAVITSLLVVSGCMFSSGSRDASQAPAVTPTPLPGGYQLPDGTWVLAPGGSDQDNYTELSNSSQPVVSGQAKDWGTSKDTYARGETAAGWVYVTNTGNVPINTIDFTITIKKTIFFIPIEKSYDYSKTGLNIPPGDTQQVEFSQAIPSEYGGVSTAGDYQLAATAKLAGQEIGHYSKGIMVV